MSEKLFSKYLGKLEVEVGEEKLELDVQLRDKQKIMTLMSKFGKEISEESLEGLTNIYLDILKRSYPDATEEELKAFLTRKMEDFMTGLAVAFGWTTKERLKQRIEDRAKKGIPRSEEEEVSQ